MQEALSLNAEGKRKLEALRVQIEDQLDADLLALAGPIQSGAEHKVRRALEPMNDRRRKLAILLCRRRPVPVEI